MHFGLHHLAAESVHKVRVPLLTEPNSSRTQDPALGQATSVFRSLAKIGVIHDYTVTVLSDSAVEAV